MQSKYKILTNVQTDLLLLLLLSVVVLFLLLYNIFTTETTICALFKATKLVKTFYPFTLQRLTFLHFYYVQTECNDLQIFLNLYSVGCSKIFNVQTDKIMFSIHSF